MLPQATPLFSPHRQPSHHVHVTIIRAGSAPGSYTHAALIACQHLAALIGGEEGEP